MDHEPGGEMVPAGVAQDGDALAGEVRALARDVRDLARIASQREQVIDKLHDEVQRLRAGELLQAVDPLLRDLIMIYDRMGDALRRGEGILAMFCDMVEDALARQGVEKITAAVGMKMDPKEHRAWRPVPTDDPARDGEIAAVVRAGFRRDARVIRPAEVEVFRSMRATAGN